MVVAEVLPDIVSAVRRAGGRFSVNIAWLDRRESAEVGPVEMHDSASAQDRHSLVEAIAEAEEIATAVPSVQHYSTSGEGSIHRLLAEGLRRKAQAHLHRAVVYAAENHNQAAEILEGHVLGAVPPEEHAAVQSRVRFLNTVIGKMSGVVADPGEVREQDLVTITPCERRAFLVESFNRILISDIRFAGGARFRRGIAVFEEKPNLLPFEEAKLHGHNATHAIAAYVGAIRGVRRIADLVGVPGALAFLEAAFIQESGEALIRKHVARDPLFTPGGYRAYALDLLARMTNPFLLDTVDRVGRDPERKLGWNDRLVGTMRIALRQGVVPRRYAFGAAAAAAVLEPSILECDTPVSALLDPLWRGADSETGERKAVLELVEEGRELLRRWRRSGFPDLERLFH